MLDLSDWAWLIIVGIWFLVKLLGRAFRSRSAQTATQKSSEAPQQASPTPALGSYGGGEPERFRETSAKPIVPK